jgi:hypothetical protein
MAINEPAGLEFSITLAIPRFLLIILSNTHTAAGGTNPKRAAWQNLVKKSTTLTADKCRPAAASSDS